MANKNNSPPPVYKMKTAQLSITLRLFKNIVIQNNKAVDHVS